MKNFIKKRWFRVIVTVAPSALAISVVLVMFFFGWRLTYAPELESSWEAISAVAAWVGTLVSVIGVAASFVAIWYAIKVPQKIADRQDKIALYDKRLKIHESLYAVIDFMDYIEEADEVQYDIYQIQMKYWSIHDVFQNDFLYKMNGRNSFRMLFTSNCLYEDVFSIQSVPHLLPGASKAKCEEMVKTLKEFIICLFQPPNNLTQSLHNGEYVQKKDSFLLCKVDLRNICDKLDKLLDI